MVPILELASFASGKEPFVDIKGSHIAWPPTVAETLGTAQDPDASVTTHSSPSPFGISSNYATAPGLAPEMLHGAFPLLPASRAACQGWSRSAGYTCLPGAIPAVTGMPLACNSCLAPHRGSSSLLSFEGQ